MISLDVRRFSYRQEETGLNGIKEEWFKKPPNTSEWRVYDRTYGPGMWISNEHSSMNIKPEIPDKDDQTDWKHYIFSYRYGKPGTHPDDHGFNAIVSDQYLSTPRGEGIYYFWTTIMTDEPGDVSCSYGKGIQQIWLDNKPLFDDIPKKAGILSCKLNSGNTPLLIGQSAGTNSYVCFEKGQAKAIHYDMNHIPRLRWFYQKNALTYNSRPWDKKHVGWYQFQLPIGTSSINLPFTNNARIWINGKEHEVKNQHVKIDQPLDKVQFASIRLVQSPGLYAGMAWKHPLTIETKPFLVKIADWRDYGITGYSGLGIYEKEIQLKHLPENARVMLDLGEVYSTASVKVNGEAIATRVWRPFQFDLTSAMQSGKNRIRIETANTLANYWKYETPTCYVYEGQKNLEFMVLLFFV